ncbi:MAG: 4-hydroxy-tetrahydrodipicolinate synthase [Clostridia bacterium]|nr:4-hydroxy-tetrahydrodipicolinate synthase [Clostridia bacterium]
MFKGAFTALITPFKENGKINYEVFSELIEYQIENDIDGLVICGTTGESSTLTITEKKKLIKYAIDKVHKRVPVIIGTGTNNTRSSIELSQYAEKVGADGLLLVTPYYNKTSQKGLVEHFTAIADSVNIPCILYNVPSRTGINIEPDTVSKLAMVNNIVGIKEASGNFTKILEIISKVPKDFAVLSGNDDSIVPLLAIGGTGVISVLSNLFPKEVHMMCKAYYDGDVKYARDLQIKFAGLIKALFSEVNPMPVKDALNLLGFFVGNPRLPLTTVSLNTHELLKQELDNIVQVN